MIAKNSWRSFHIKVLFMLPLSSCDGDYTHYLICERDVTIRDN